MKTVIIGGVAAGTKVAAKLKREAPQDEVVIYTKGTEGAEFITKERKIFSPSFKVQAQDTTGAGDSFIGSFLYQVAEGDNTLESLVNLPKENIKIISI